MAHGKPADTPCIHLDMEMRCQIFHHQSRPVVCAGFQPSPETCGENREQALHYLRTLEKLTRNDDTI